MKRIIRALGSYSACGISCLAVSAMLGFEGKPGLAAANFGVAVAFCAIHELKRIADAMASPCCGCGEDHR